MGTAKNCLEDKGGTQSVEEILAGWCRRVLQKLLLTPTVWVLLLQEQELKAAADGVLSEVRKKQADTKRMVDILRALEKLRKLRKEAAARKGN